MAPFKSYNFYLKHFFQKYIAFEIFWKFGAFDDFLDDRKFWKFRETFDKTDGRMSLVILRKAIVDSLSHPRMHHSSFPLRIFAYYLSLSLSLGYAHFSLSVTYWTYACIRLPISIGRSRELCVTKCITLSFSLLSAAPLF